MPKINSLEVVHQDTNKDSYQNLHDLLVKFKKFYDESAGREVIDAEARAAYEVLMEMYVNDKEAFARRIETLSAKFGNSLAQVVEEMLVYASKSEAWAKKISSVSAELDSANARIDTESYTRVTEDEALASQITTLSSTIGSKNRTYYQSTAPSSEMVAGDLWIDSDDDKLYRYNGSSWVNIQDNDIAVNTAAISSEATTRATADSANATAINAVTARLDTGDFATVKTQSSTTASKVSGIEAKWGVTTNVNGYVAGIQLLNGGSTSSSFTVDATKFIVKKPDGTNGIAWDGTNSRLDIAGDVFANSFTSTSGGVINTADVVTTAISNSASANVSGYTSNLNLSITTAGGKTYVSGHFFVGGVTGPASALIQLYRGGSLLATFEAYVPDGASAAGVGVAYSETPPTGSNTYTFVKNGTYMDGAAYVIELKR